MMKTFLENLEMLSMAIGTSGDEGAVRKLIYDEVIAYPGCIAKTDNAGNLIVSKKGAKEPKNKVMFTANMDEIGFMITHIDEKGFLGFSNIGSIDSRVIVGKRVLVGKNAIPGLLGSKAIHLVKKEEFDNPTKTSDLYIDIGAESKEEAEKLVSLGERAVFDSDFCKYGENSVLGRALESRTCCAALMELLKEDAEYSFTVCFTVRGEIRGNGAPAAAFGVAPDISVSVEGAAAGDTPGIPGEKSLCKQGKGTVLSFRDNGTLYDLDLYHFVSETAEKEGIPSQTRTGIFGTGAAEAIHKTRGGIRPVSVGIPVRYIHSPYSALLLSDAESTVSLLKVLSKGLCEV